MYVCTCFCKCVCLCVYDTVTSVTTIEIRIYMKIYQFVVVVDWYGAPPCSEWQTGRHARHDGHADAALY